MEPDLEFECWLVESLDRGAVRAGDVLIMWKDRLDIDWLDNVQQRVSLLDMAKRGTNMLYGGVGIWLHVMRAWNLLSLILYLDLYHSRFNAVQAEVKQSRHFAPT